MKINKNVDPVLTVNSKQITFSKNITSFKEMSALNCLLTVKYYSIIFMFILTFCACEGNIKMHLTETACINECCISAVKPCL